MTTRISKAALSNFPKKIADRLTELKARFGVKSFYYDDKPERTDFYFGEGDKNWFFYGNEEINVNMVSSETIGGGDRTEIGSTIKPKAGTTILNVGYLGGYHLFIYNYSATAIAPE